MPPSRGTKILASNMIYVTLAAASELSPYNIGVLSPCYNPSQSVNDVIIGAAVRTIFYGFGGNDINSGLQGPDIVDGFDNDDHLIGQEHRVRRQHRRLIRASAAPGTI